MPGYRKIGESPEMTFASGQTLSHYLLLVGLSPYDIKDLENGQDFAPIRDDPGFRTILPKAKEQLPGEGDSR